MTEHVLMTLESDPIDQQALGIKQAGGENPLKSEMSINIVQTETVAYLQAGTIQNTFHPHSAASFPDDVCDQQIIKTSGNGGSGQQK